MLRRQEMRQRFDIEGNGCTDCLVTTFCGSCSLAQMNMQVKAQLQKPPTYTMDQRTAYSKERQGMLYAQQ